MQQIKSVALSTIFTAGAFFAGAASADKTIDEILRVGQSKTSAAKASQDKINKLSSETATLLQQFKIVNKQIDGLRVYNSQLEKQLANQLKVINDLEESIDNVTVIERQIQPLILRMLEGLEQFVELDTPLYREERLERVAELRGNQHRADISVAEKFRQILEAYNIEAEYGRKLHVYTGKLEVGGVEREVNIFGVGKIALMYQTPDTKYSGAWDQSQGAWIELDAGKYRSAIQNGIKIALKQASNNVMELPILAPEAAK